VIRHPDPDVRFDGRVVLVTGAGRGLGREFALLLAGRGATVVVNDIGVSSDVERYVAIRERAAGLTADALDAGVADAVAQEITDAGGRAAASRADVTDEHAVDRMVADALETFGRLDAVINNAGVVPFGDLEHTTGADLLQALLVHVGGAFHVTKAAWPAMRAQGYGRVVNVCSTQGVLTGGAGFGAYAAAKGGLAGMTRCLATEGVDAGILVNGLVPGATTRGNVSVDAGYVRAPELDRSPVMVAPAACWLASERCVVSGCFYAATAGSMRAVFAAAAVGYQSPRPGAFSLEEVRDNWDAIRSHDGAIAPTSQAEYNEFRMSLYRRFAGDPSV
jgi:NAD(P)-dependent dehydrogenase (short-subunit alcohol dehydrogenase family)